MEKLYIQQYFNADFRDIDSLVNDILIPILCGGDENMYEKGYDYITDDEIREQAERANIKEIQHAATLYAGELKIKVFDVVLKNNCNIERSRKGIQQLVRKYIEHFEGAIMAFRYDDPTDRPWRLSYMEKRKSGVDSTNAKRYTYLCGKMYSCHTLAEQFYTLQDGEISATKIEKAFSVEALTQEFYNKLYNWYLWARDRRTGVTFPNNPVIDTDDRDEIEVKIIRLITRMLFVWFIKQKNLVPDYLFDTDYLTTILKDFDPQSSSQGNYYNAILQNLFFATLNQEIDKREFIENPHYFGRGKRSSESYGVKNLYRDNTKASWFTFPEDIKEQEVIRMFSTIPYLNGGLFECLDKFDLDENERKYKPLTYYDGFSSNDARSDNRKNLKYRAFIPNELFFLQQPKTVIVTIKQAEGDKAEETAQVQVIGLIELFKQYNFTVEENTTTDTEVSLDPELLGRVFENLLAAYNPETQESARKSTGSYYTPREIVDYMVDESLKAYFTGECGNDKAEVESLFRDGTVSSPAIAEKLDRDLRVVKVLDPACGSGAFPMGILLRMTDLLEHLEGERFNRYETKLQIIKDCIYGIDIQSIAMLICKLRFFISLICDTDYDPNNPDNFGIIPLPSLETKFVAANSLLPAKVKEFDNTLTQDPVLQEMKEELLALRKSILQQHTTSEKMENRRRDRALCKRMQQYIIENAGKPNEDIIRQCEQSIRECETLLPKYAGERLQKMVEQDIFGGETVTYIDRNKEERERLQSTIRSAKTRIETERNKVLSDKFLQAVQDVTNWDPYNQNTFSPFFDAEWMFGIGISGASKQGFDIVIGNPPYISAPTQVASKGLAEQRKKIIDSKQYKSLYQKWDLYIPFMELGIRHLCCEGGIMTMIVPYPLTNQMYAEKLRKMFTHEYNLYSIVDLNGTKIFDNAIVSNCIPFVRKTPQTPNIIIAHINEQKQISPAFEQSLNNLRQDEKSEVWNLTQEQRQTNRHAGMHTLGDFCYISYGLRPNSDEKTAKGEFRKEDLISLTQDEIHCRPYIEAKDISKYKINRVRFLEYDTERCPSKIARPTFRELYQHPKIIVNTIGNIIAMIDENNLIHNHSISACVKWIDLSGVENRSIDGVIKKFSSFTRDDMEILSKKIELKYLLGILNSKYAMVLLKNIRGGAMNVYPEYIRNLPIPLATATQQQPIIDLVDTILAKKKANPGADTSIEEKAIDQLVYKLYDLNENEIKLIENS